MSWDQLRSILEEAREIAALEAASPPVDCPECGTALRSGPSGVLYCPFDGWRSNT